MFGLPNKSITMVGMLVQWVTRHLEIKCPATSRSQRGMMTKLAPNKMLVCITLTMPVMWNMGTTHSVTFSGVPLPHKPLAMALCMRVPWVCMHPLGKPVVPLV